MAETLSRRIAERADVIVRAAAIASSGEDGQDATRGTSSR